MIDKCEILGLLSRKTRGCSSKPSKIWRTWAAGKAQLSAESQLPYFVALCNVLICPGIKFLPVTLAKKSYNQDGYCNIPISQATVIWGEVSDLVQQWRHKDLGSCHLCEKLVNRFWALSLTCSSISCCNIWEVKQQRFPSLPFVLYISICVCMCVHMCISKSLSIRLLSRQIKL